MSPARGRDRVRSDAAERRPRHVRAGDDVVAAGPAGAACGQGDRGAAAALRVLDDPTGFLSTVQVGITLVGILAGAISGATLGGHLAGLLTDAGVPAATADTLASAGVVAAITYLSLVVGELVPKRLALTNPEGVASRVAAPMALLARLGAPLVWLLRASTNAVLRLLGVGDPPASRVTEEEIGRCWPRARRPAS